jgi:type I restriction enzyme S subunit
LGEVAQIRTEEKIALAQRVITLRGKKNVIDSTYLKYFLISPIGQGNLKAKETGSTVTGIKQSELKLVEIYAPSFLEQVEIASILSSLDDKIELNLQMNQTLEAIAQAIFKEWFVNFNFPGFDGQLVDGLPKGWIKKNLSELVDTVSKTHKFPKGKAVFLNTSDISEGKFLHGNYSDFGTLPGQAKKTIQYGDILFSEIRPANKRYAFVDFEAIDYVVSTKLMVLRSKGILDNLVIYFFMKSNEVLNQLQLLAESRSGTFPQITYTELAKIELNIPSADILKLFTEYLWSAFKKIRENQSQIESLTQLRDSLLPKLMTGKITVKV